MKISRRKFSAVFKDKVTIEVIKEQTGLPVEYRPLGGYGAKLHNFYQGAQYISKEHIDVLKNNILISMDSKGRALNNIYIQGFWKSIKYERYILVLIKW